jgi:hypothetical protein
MKTENRPQSPLPDPFEELLRRRLGPATLEMPPAELRARVLQQVAALPTEPERFRLRLVYLANALALSFLAVLSFWLVTGPLRGVEGWAARLGRELPSLAPPREWQASLDLLFGGGLLELARNPLILTVLPLLLLPVFYYLQDEN